MIAAARLATGSPATSLPLILCADADEAELLRQRGFDATDGSAKRSVIEVIRFGRRDVILTPRARIPGYGLAAQFAGAGCRVEALLNGADIDIVDPLSLPRERLFAAADPAVLAELAGKPPPLRFLSIAELLMLGAPLWKIHRILPRRGLVVVFGQTGAAKTFFAFDLCAGASRGDRWRGARVKRSGAVVYIAAEGHLKLRARAYLEHNPGADLSLLRILQARLNLQPGGDVSELIEGLERVAAELGGVSVVVIDTLNSVLAGGDENSSEDMGGVIGTARRIVEEFDCVLIFVHHSGKNVQLGARGHSSLRAAADTEIEVSEAEDGTRVAEIKKQRDGESGARFPFRLVPYAWPSEDPDAEPNEAEDSCAVEHLDDEIASASKKPAKPMRLTEGARTALRALREAVSEYGETYPGTSAIPPGIRAASGDAWRRRYYALDGLDVDSQDPKEVDRERDARKKRFKRARLALIDAGEVGSVNDLCWVNQ